MFASLTAKEEMRILLLGQDAAGKTTALYKMQLGEVITTIPTIGERGRSHYCRGSSCWVLGCGGGRRCERE